jgi:tRNA-2-methylthio-N6-dimethylallyladenosine synthase
VQERYERLAALQDRITREENEKLVGQTVEVLVGAEKGRKGDRWSGRAEDSRLVHFDLGSDAPRPGDVVTVRIIEASTFHLVAGEPLAVRRTRSGEAWDRAEAESCAVPSATPSKPGSASLGMPTLRIGSPSVATIPIYDITDSLR